MTTGFRTRSLALLGTAGLLLLAPACRRHDPGSFATPEEAVRLTAELLDAPEDGGR